MLKTIEVRSKSKAREFISDVPWAAISIASYDGDWPKLNAAKRMGLLQLWFADLEFERGDPEIMFQHSHAKQIYKFIAEMQEKEVELLLIHCEAGISRSPAIAAAVAQAFLGENATPYFKKYNPNQLVYKKMVQEGIGLGHLKYDEEFSPYITPEDDDFYYFRTCGGMEE